MSCTPETDTERVRIREHYRARLSDIVREIKLDADKMLSLDLRDPRLAGRFVPDRDAFTYRANEIGLALFDEHFYSVAEQLYIALREKTLDYRNPDRWRHAGLLYANQGIACWAQGNVEDAIKLWLLAAQEDRKTYTQEPMDTFAMSKLFEEYVRQPARQYALEAVQQINQDLKPHDVEGLCSYLRNSRNSELEFAFMACMVTVHRHGGAKQFPNPFSAIRTLDALRNLSCLLEVELKSIASQTEGSLYHAITAVFKNKPWWRAFQRKVGKVNGQLKHAAPLDEQLRKAIDQAPTNEEARLCQSALVAYIVRNYVAHWIDTECTLVREYSHKALGHILHVMIAAHRHEAT